VCHMRRRIHVCHAVCLRVQLTYVCHMRRRILNPKP